MLDVTSARARVAPLMTLVSVALAGCGGASPAAFPPDDAPPPRWVAAAGAAQDERAPDELAVTDATVRMVLRATVAGRAARVRLENRYGGVGVHLGGVSLGLREAGAAAVPGSLRRVTFGGAFDVTLPAGDRVTSDPVDLEVLAGADLVVSLYVPGSRVPVTWHRQALVTSYRTPDGAGDLVGEAGGAAFELATDQLYWVAGIDLLSTAAGAVGAFGSSSTDGTGATRDGYDRWPDRLATRLAGRVGVVNAGIAGNTLLDWPSSPGAGPPGLERLDADALDLPGVSHLILFHGSNDIARGAAAEQVVAGLEAAIGRAKARGLAVLGATIGPRTYSSPAAMHAVRRAVNEWIRTGGAYDGVIDFDAVLRDPAAPDRIRPEYDSGDHVHPNPAGYAAMAEAIDLDLFAPVSAAAP